MVRFNPNLSCWLKVNTAIAAAIVVSSAPSFGAPARQDARVAAAISDPTRTDKDRAMDKDRHPQELLAFLHLRRGQTIADVWPGDYWDRLFADVVGPSGKVYAVHLAEADKVERVVTPAAGSAPFPDHANVSVVVTGANTLTLPAKVDVVWIRQNYHDLYDPFMGPADVPAFNKAVYRALKPGGLFVVIDHSAPDGTGLVSTNTTHRIDAAVVKKDMAAAGFKFVGESSALRNAADNRTTLVFDKSIRGRTDQFVYVFKRP